MANCCFGRHSRSITISFGRCSRRRTLSRYLVNGTDAVPLSITKTGSKWVGNPLSRNFSSETMRTRFFFCKVWRRDSTASGCGSTRNTNGLMRVAGEGDIRTSTDSIFAGAEWVKQFLPVLIPDVKFFGTWTPDSVINRHLTLEMIGTIQSEG